MKQHVRLIVLAVTLLVFFTSGSLVVAQDVNVKTELKDVLDGLKADKPWGIIKVEGAHDFWIADAAVFIDVRAPDEYNAGHIPGAINIPLETIPNNLNKMPNDKDTLIVAYCKSGWRASIGMVSLKLLGYENTKGFSGSWLAWTKAKYPVKEGAQP